MCCSLWSAIQTKLRRAQSSNMGAGCSSQVAPEGPTLEDHSILKSHLVDSQRSIDNLRSEVQRLDATVQEQKMALEKRNMEMAMVGAATKTPKPSMFEQSLPEYANDELEAQMLLASATAKLAREAPAPVEEDPDQDPAPPPAPAPVPDPAPLLEPKAEAAVEPAPEPAPEPQPEAAVEPAPEPAPAPQPEAAVEPAPEPAPEPQPEAAVEAEAMVEVLSDGAMVWKFTDAQKAAVDAFTAVQGAHGGLNAAVPVPALCAALQAIPGSEGILSTLEGSAEPVSFAAFLKVVQQAPAAPEAAAAAAEGGPGAAGPGGELKLKLVEETCSMGDELKLYTTSPVLWRYAWRFSPLQSTLIQSFLSLQEQDTASGLVSTQALAQKLQTDGAQPVPGQLAGAGTISFPELMKIVEDLAAPAASTSPQTAAPEQPKPSMLFTNSPVTWRFTPPQDKLVSVFSACTGNGASVSEKGLVAALRVDESAAGAETDHVISKLDAESDSPIALPAFLKLVEETFSMGASSGSLAKWGISTRETGTKFTLDYRMFFDHQQLGPVSPWHDLPLATGDGDGTYNFVCEIPKWSRAKFEVSVKEEGNPIKQDESKGDVRYYKWGDMLFNYGFLPQTWEDPDQTNEATGCAGDDDPIDFVEVGAKQMVTGQSEPCKVLGVLGMIDGGETDWKVIGIRRDDALAPLLNDIGDLEREIPGAVSAIREWLRQYKTAEGKKLNVFALDEECMPKDYALGIIEECHQQWKQGHASKQKFFA